MIHRDPTREIRIGDVVHVTAHPGLWAIVEFKRRGGCSGARALRCKSFPDGDESRVFAASAIGQVEHPAGSEPSAEFWKAHEESWPT